MPVTRDQAHMLAALAIACRPTGAPKWDAPGVVAAIGKVANLLLADVAHATLRAAEDATALTPGVIAATASVHWRERSPHRTTPGPPTREQACLTCGAWLESCKCGATTQRPVGLNPRASEHAEAAREALRRSRVDSGATDALGGAVSEGEA